MSVIAGEVSPLFQRVERPRKAKREPVTSHERLVDEALAEWKQWVCIYLLPKDSVHRSQFAQGTTYEANIDNCFMPKTRSGPVNPTLGAILADERALAAWPKTIHALITDLPPTHRCALLGEALGYSQGVIGSYIGVSQPRVCLVLKSAKRTLGIQLAVMAHVRRANEAIIREQSR